MVEDRRREVGGRDGVVLDVAAELVGRAVDLAAADAAAGQERR